MSTPESLTAALATLTRAIDDPDIDLDAQLGDLRATVEGAISSYRGMTLTIAVEPQTVHLSTLPRATAQIATSLTVPLTAVGASQPFATLTLYAGTPGAFVDLAADLNYALGAHDDPAVLDRDLTPYDEPGHADLDEYTTINRAIGALLDRGHTQESATQELRRLSAIDSGNTHVAAQGVLRALNSGPNHHGQQPTLP